MSTARFSQASLVLVFTFAFSRLLLKAQETGSEKTSGLIQAEFGVLPFGHTEQTTIAQLNALQTGDDNLDRNFSSYDTSQGIVYYNGFPAEWYAGVSCFRNLKAKKGVSWSIGLKYHQVYLGGQGYSYSETIARDTFFNAQGQGIVEYEVISDRVDFIVGAHEMLVPVSLCWSGKKERLIWVEPGIQLFPGIMFGARFDDYETLSLTKQVTPVGEEPEDSHTYSPDSVSYFHKYVPLGGGGFSLNAGIPVTLYLRVSKTHRVFSRIQLVANITPLFRYSFFPGMGAQKYTTTSLAFGLRYHL